MVQHNGGTPVSHNKKFRHEIGEVGVGFGFSSVFLLEGS